MRRFIMIVMGFAAFQVNAATASNFRLVDNNDGTVTLSWTMSGSSGFLYSGYNVAVSRGTSPNQSASTRTLIEGDSGSYMTQQGSAGSVKDRPPATGNTYYYWLHYSDYSILDDTQNFFFNYLAGTKSAILSAPCIGPIEYKAGAELVAPSNVSAVTGERPQSVEISWDAVDGATSYDVEYSLDNETYDGLPNFNGTSQTSVGFIWTLSSPDTELPRCYRVTAKSSDATSDPSEPAHWQYEAQPFPSAVRADSISHSSGALTIAWNNPDNPLPQGLWYTVYRNSSLDTSTWVKLGDTQDQFWTDVGFADATKNGSAHYWVQTGSGIYFLSAPVESGRKFGVFVGIDNYENNWCESREHCVVAATGIRSRYIGNGGYLFTNAQAVKSDIINAIATCSESARVGDSFVYLHASHGIRYTTGGYAGPALYTDGEYITPQEFGNALNGFAEGVSIAVILDSCYSGAMRTSVSLTHSQDVGWITSTSGSEISHSIGAKGFASSGILQSGWEYGCADSDGDGYVTLLELGDYAKLWNESALDIYNANPYVGSSRDVLGHMMGGVVGGGVCPALGSGLTVSAAQRGTGIAVSWNVVSGSEGYSLYRTGPDATLQSLAGPTEIKDGMITFRDDAIDAGAEYTYYVKPYNAAFIGRAASASATYTVPDELQQYVARYWNPATPEGRQNGPYTQDGKIAPAKLSLDSDGDGFSLYDEYVAGTNPLDREDVFKSKIKVEGDTCTISWYPDLGAARKYTVRGTEVLGGEWRTRDSACRYFKVNVELNATP